MTPASKPVYTVDWFSHNEAVWARLLAPLAGRPGVRALEIGCYEGRATCWLLANVLTGAGARIDCIDTFEGSDQDAPLGISMDGVRGRFDANVAPWRDQVGLHVGRSASVLRGLRGPYDLAYVDGSHEAADVIADAVLAWPLVAADGVLIFDDYEWDQFRRPERNPRLGIDAFLACHAGRYDLLHRGYQVAVRKLGSYSESAAAAILPANPRGH
jgi:predicted O-methyltransferase YrrM